MNPQKKIIRVVAATIVFLIVLIGITLAFEDGYIFTAINNTYLKGRLTPTINSTGVNLTNHVREIKTALAQPWPVAALDKRSTLPTAVQHRMSAYKTAAFVVIKDGTIVKEVYWPGYDGQSRTNSNSVAKSIVSTLVGVALAEGKIKSLDQTVGDFLPGFSTGRRGKITIRHLLTMSAATDFSENYDNPLDFTARAHFGTDITALLLKHFNPVAEPGLTHKYDSSNTALLGLLLARATGQSLSGYTSEKLWKPMGAEHNALWSLDSNKGVERAYCCIYATARDYARIGQLYLNGGSWNGKQLIPASYISQATSAAPLRDAAAHPTQRYGYSWWRMTHQGHQIYYAWGYQGQYVAIIPDKKIVMVRLGDGGGYTEDHHLQDLPLYLEAALAN
jgi:CubicO group peptidase (beta-lactamase class C family)